MHTENKNRVNIDFLPETNILEENEMTCLKWAAEHCNTEFTITKMILQSLEDEIKISFETKRKPESSTIRPALQELFKEVIQKKEDNTNWKVNKAEMGNMWINLRGFVFHLKI